MSANARPVAACGLRRPLGAVRIATANVYRALACSDPDEIDARLMVLNGSLFELEDRLKRLPKAIRRRWRRRHRHDFEAAELAMFEGSSTLSQAESFLDDLLRAVSGRLISA